MKIARIVAGIACIVLAFGLIVLLSMGGWSSADAPSTGAPALIALMPGVAIGLTVFALGLWLIATGRKP
ncbi:MAG: hypothetical protein ACREP7_07675 [Lysobacter sp.]